MITTDDRPVVANQLRTRSLLLPLALACVPPQLGNSAAKAKNVQAKAVDVVGNVWRYAPAGSHLSDAHTGTAMRALHPDFFSFFFFFRCFDLASAYQFVECEGEAGRRPGAAAVTGGEVRKCRMNTGNFTCRDYYLDSAV